MSPAVASLLCLALAGLGFASLSLTMGRHAGAVLGGSLDGPLLRLVGVAGWCLLAASLVGCLGAMECGTALVTWAGLLTAAALPLSLCLGRAPRAALVAGPVASLCAAGLLALAG